MTGQPDQPTLPETMDDVRQETARGLPPQSPRPVEQATKGRAVQADMRQAELHPGDSVQEQLIARLWRLPPGHPSSPYDSEGRLRPPVPDWRELGRAMPDGEPGEKEASDPADELGSADLGTSGDQQTLRADRSRDDADSGQEALQAWRDAASGLSDLWKKHEEKWPEDKRPPVDRSSDEPGSWRGDSGLLLGARANRRIGEIHEDIAAHEEGITLRMEKVEESSAGNLIGKEHRLKGVERFKDKIATALDDAPGADVERVALNVRDVVRYTLQYDETSYTEGVKADIERLKSEEFELIKLKNLWGDDEYKGINAQWRDQRTGQPFEIQFHTLISFEAKQLTHGAYERLRTIRPGASPDYESQVAELHNYQRIVCTEIPIPADVAEISDYPQRERHGRKDDLLRTTP